MFSCSRVSFAHPFLFFISFPKKKKKKKLSFQFYSWYAHSIPLLLWSTPFPAPAKVAIWLAIEGVWNSFPPSPLGSAALWSAHLLLLAGLWVGVGGGGAGDAKEKKKEGQGSARS